MKRFFFLSSFILLLYGGLMSQVPGGINFQAVARDASGAPLANQTIDVRFTIQSGGRVNVTFFQETHTGASTNAFGLFSLMIGAGTASIGHLDSVKWMNHNTIYLGVEVDDGNGFVVLGRTRFLTTPYAYYAQNAGKALSMSIDDLVDVDTTGLQNGSTLQWNANSAQFEPGVPGNGNGNCCFWQQSAYDPNDIIYNTGNVGVGTVNPGSRLTVRGGGLSFTHALATSQRDVISFYSNRLDLNTMTGLGFETNTYATGQGSTLERVFYSKAEGGFRWYLRTNADGGNSASMYLNREGDLGIGTPNPRAPLHVAKVNYMTNTLDGSLMVGDRSAGYITMDDNEIQARYNGSGTTLWLQHRGGNLAMVTGGGEVGVGTFAPAAKLHVMNGSDVNLGSGGYLLMGGTTGYNLAMDNNEIQARNNAAAANLYLQNLGGRVGIGAGAPQVQLHVHDGSDVVLGGGGYLCLGSTSGANLVMDNNEIMARNNGQNADILLQNMGGRVGIGTSSSDARLNVRDDGWQLRLNNPDAGGTDWLMGASNNSWIVGGNKLVFSASSTSSNGLLVLDANQDAVGINTHDIAAGYKLAVDGRIICEGLRCEMSQNWPDYVFAPDYVLRPLEEVADYIAENHHLPGIPAAAVVEAEGLSVDEMQIKMMEKIEELTLYMIEMKAENQQLQKELSALKASVQGQ